MPKPDNAAVKSRFQYSATDTSVVADACNVLAQTLDAILPTGREKDLATDKLEEVMFWAAAAISRT